MNKNIDRIIDVAAYIIGTAWDLADQAREHIPAILFMLANLASNLATLATCLASCLALGYTALKPVCVAQARAGARALRAGGTLLRASAPLVLKRLYACLRACMDLVKGSQGLVKEQVKKLKDYASAAWQFRKECLA